MWETIGTSSGLGQPRPFDLDTETVPLPREISEKGI